MSFTESEIEVIADHMRSAGFDIPQDWDADRLGLLATAVLEALEMCRANKAPND